MAEETATKKTEKPWEDDPGIGMDTGMGLIGSGIQVDELSGPWDNDPSVLGTPGEKVTAFGQGFTGGLARGGLFAAGVGAGAGLGSLGGPAAPITIPLGAAIGGAVAMGAGEEAVDFLSNIPSPGTLLGFGDATMIRRPEDMQQSLRPFFYGGEVTGGSLPFAAAPLTAARLGGTTELKVGSFFNRIVDFAGRHPKSFALTEASGISGAALGEGIAEETAPGEPLKRLGAGILGGLFNPARVILTTANKSMDSLAFAWQSLTRSGRETRAGSILQRIVQDAGGDPAAMARILREEGFPTSLTAAQKTGHPTLISLENELLGGSKKYGAEAVKKAKDGLLAIRNAINLLRGTGDPEALRAAATLRAQHFRTLFAARIQIAEDAAIEAANKITKDTPASRSALSKQARGLLDDAMRSSRFAEKALWGDVPKKISAFADNIMGQYTQLKSEMLPGETLPKVVEDFVATFGDGAPTDSGMLIRFRNRMLTHARKAAANNDFDEARVFGELAESALDDLDNLFTGPRASSLLREGVDTEAYDTARTFSREFNDVFTRTFAGKALAKGKGGERIPPELMMRRAFATGKEAGELNFTQMEEALSFLPTRGVGGEQATLNLEVMLELQKRILRLAASDAINPNTGLVNPNKLAKFLKDNEGLLSRFPEIRVDLGDAVSAQKLLNNVQKASARSSRIIDMKAAFSKIAKVENPVEHVRSMLSRGNKKPVNSIKELIKLARREGPEAMDGAKASFWEYALDTATTREGGFSFDRLKAVLFDELRPGQDSLMTILKNEGLLSADDISRATTLLDKADNILNAMAGKSNIDDVIGEVDAFTDLIIRIGGASIGTEVSSKIPIGGSGKSLIAAAGGSRFMRNMLEVLPFTRLREVLTEAVLEPKFFAMLLEKPTTRAAELRMARQIHAYLWQVGLIDFPSELPQMIPGPETNPEHPGEFALPEGFEVTGEENGKRIIRNQDGEEFIEE